MRQKSALCIPILLPVILLCCACAVAGKTNVHDTVASSDQLETGKPESSDQCPSRDFATFLKMYLDVGSDSVRVSFTDKQVQYLVPYYLVEEPTDTSPDMHVSQLSGPDRFRHISVRYFKAADGFYSADDGVPDRGSAGHSREARYPLKIEAVKDGGQSAIFGLEYETETYGFSRRNNCWYLSQIINPRD